MTFWWQIMSQTHKYQRRVRLLPSALPSPLGRHQPGQGPFQPEHSWTGLCCSSGSEGGPQQGPEFWAAPERKVTVADCLSCWIQDRPEFNGPMRRSVSFYTTFFHNFLHISAQKVTLMSNRRKNVRDDILCIKSQTPTVLQLLWLIFNIII